MEWKGIVKEISRQHLTISEGDEAARMGIEAVINKLRIMMKNISQTVREIQNRFGERKGIPH